MILFAQEFSVSESNHINVQNLVLGAIFGLVGQSFRIQCCAVLDTTDDLSINGIQKVEAEVDGVIQFSKEAEIRQGHNRIFFPIVIIISEKRQLPVSLKIGNSIVLTSYLNIDSIYPPKLEIESAHVVSATTGLPVKVQIKK